MVDLEWQLPAKLCPKYRGTYAMNEDQHFDRSAASAAPV